jgi:hypothetical protein
MGSLQVDVLWLQDQGHNVWLLRPLCSGSQAILRLDAHSLLLAFYNFPAEHADQLRTANPIGKAKASDTSHPVTLSSRALDEPWFNNCFRRAPVFVSLVSL